jgi:prepilin-type N-terminal cleavage/methylation domain-containing protein
MTYKNTHKNTRENTQAGFNLIELIIALSITSVLLLSIFGVIRRIQQSVRQVSGTIDKGTVASVFADQLERDVLGMFSPDIVQQELKMPSGKTQIKEQIKKWEPVYSVQKSDRGLVWSFITTGGLEVVTAQGRILTQPLVRRVLYKLEPQQESRQLYRLLYGYAVDDLDFNKLASKPSEQLYELARNVTDITLEHTVFEVAQPQQSQKSIEQAGAAQEKLQLPKPVTLSTWSTDEVREKYKTALPAFINLSGTFVSRLTEQQTPFVFEFAVPSYEIIVPASAPATDKTIDKAADKEKA